MCVTNLPGVSLLLGEPLDLSFVEAARIKLQARKGLWELLSACTAQIQEWKLLMFKKVQKYDVCCSCAIMLET